MVIFNSNVAITGQGPLISPVTMVQASRVARTASAAPDLGVPQTAPAAGRQAVAGQLGRSGRQWWRPTTSWGSPGTDKLIEIGGKKLGNRP